VPVIEIMDAWIDCLTYRDEDDVEDRASAPTGGPQTIKAAARRADYGGKATVSSGVQSRTPVLRT
jgi:hypothetical protein